MAALELLREQPRRVEKLQANADVLRTELAREGFEVAGADAHVISLVVGDAPLAVRIAEHALEQGVYVGAVRPPDVAEGCARLRLVGDGLAHEVRAARRRPGARPGGVARGLPPRRGRAAGGRAGARAAAPRVFDGAALPRAA